MGVYVILGVRQIWSRIGNLLGAQRGFSLIETLVAVAILALVGVAFVQGLSTTAMGTGAYERRVTAANLAQSQIEDIKGTVYLPLEGPYPAGPVEGHYSITVDTPSGYSLSNVVEEQAEGKQEVTVKVYHQGEFVFQMTTVKVDW